MNNERKVKKVCLRKKNTLLINYIFIMMIYLYMLILIVKATEIK